MVAISMYGQYAALLLVLILSWPSVRLSTQATGATDSLPGLNTTVVFRSVAWQAGPVRCGIGGLMDTVVLHIRNVALFR